MTPVELSQTELPAPGASERVVVERPAEGLARGKYASPAWAIALFGAAVLTIALVYVFFRLKRSRRR